MGWTFQHREKGQSNLDWFRENLCGDEPERLIDCATVGGAFKGVAYCAYRTKAVPEGEPERVIALVILTQWVANDYYNFGYKDMDEGMGPGYYDCPERIFKLLDPLPEDEADPSVDGNWAAQWREHVKENIAAKAAKPKVTKGTKIRFPFPAWESYGVCEYVGGRRGTNLFRTERGSVRFRGWRSVPYEVVA